MSISGVFLILFLLFHATMNVVLLFSAEAYDLICGALGANWYAVAATMVLAGGFLVHILYATWLTLQNKRARGADRYASSSKTPTEWAAQNMYVLGLIVILGLVIHLWNFWYNMMFKELLHMPDAVEGGSQLVIDLFQNPVYVVIYLGWLVALWFHLTHGFWSAMQTVGWNNKVWFKRWHCVSNIVATVIMLMFASVPVWFFIKGLIQ